MITDDICHDDIETLCLTASPQTTERRAALKSLYFGRFQNSFCCQGRASRAGFVSRIISLVLFHIYYCLSSVNIKEHFIFALT